jgi:hypothetical protein
VAAVTRWRSLLLLAAAVLLLNGLLTFENVWPTLAIRPAASVSLELAACVLLLAAASASRHRRAAPAVLRLLSAVWVVLVAGRYAQVMAPALYGREINLYWDAQYIPDVVAMTVHAAPGWIVGAAAAAVAAALSLLYTILHWAFRRVAAAIEQPPRRRALVWISGLAVIAFAAQSSSESVPPLVATPVTQIYARQIELVAEALGGSQIVPDSPPMATTLGAVAEADVFLVFVEAYGAVSFDRADLASPLAASRAALMTDITQTGRGVVSAFVESPTFGGSSWLAHLTLMTGVEVRDPLTNARMMAQQRDTLVQVFGSHGYRTLALMPGLTQPWPEGAFYRFDEIYGEKRLQYRGPQFGWFAIPDQFSLDWIDAREMRRAGRPPLFVFFPTISTHFPFTPVPPYQPDWQRITDVLPFDEPGISAAYDEQVDWDNFAPAYTRALAYDYASLGGYLRQHRPGRDLVMILIGDHQPAAAVSGEGASWDVPIHIVSNRAGLLERLQARGFNRGLTPERPRLATMAGLLPILLDAFGSDSE